MNKQQLADEVIKNLTITHYTKQQLKEEYFSMIDAYSKHEISQREMLLKHDLYTREYKLAKHE